MLELHLVGTFALVVTLIVISPGANLFLLLQSAPTFGRHIGFLNVLGISSAILTHALLSLVGVSAIIMASSTAFTAMKIAGAAYLVWLGYKSLRGAWSYSGIKSKKQISRTELRRTPSVCRAFADGYLVNILNPKPALFYLAAFPQFINVNADSVFLQGITLALIHALIAISWYGFVVLAIDQIKGWLQKPNVWKAVQSLAGSVLIALGARLAFLKSAANS